MWRGCGFEDVKYICHTIKYEILIETGSWKTTDMSIVCMFSVFIHHHFESSFISFITFCIISHHSCILCMIRIALHTYCISKLFSGDLELLTSKLEEASRNQRTYSTIRSCTSSTILDPLVE